MKIELKTIVYPDGEELKVVRVESASGKVRLLSAHDTEIFFDMLAELGYPVSLTVAYTREGGLDLPF